MKKVESILQSFHYGSLSDFVCSVFPSLKYNLTMLIITLSVFLSSLSELLGLRSLTIIAFIALCLVELASGIYASVFVQNQKFQSNKASRFTIKLACLFIVLFVVNTYKIEYNSIGLVFVIFEWFHIVLVVYFSFEYLISIIENLGTISGKSNSTLIKAIKRKLNIFLSLNDYENENGTKDKLD